MKGYTTAGVVFMWYPLLFCRKEVKKDDYSEWRTKRGI